MNAINGFYNFKKFQILRLSEINPNRKFMSSYNVIV